MADSARPGRPSVSRRATALPMAPSPAMAMRLIDGFSSCHFVALKNITSSSPHTFLRERRHPSKASTSAATPDPCLTSRRRRFIDAHAREQSSSRPSAFVSPSPRGEARRALLDHLRAARASRRAQASCRQADPARVFSAESARRSARARRASRTPRSRRRATSRIIAGSTPAHLGDREQRVVGGDHDIAGRDHASAAAEAAGPAPAPRSGSATIEPLHGLEVARDTASFASSDPAARASIHSGGHHLEILSIALQTTTRGGRF